MARDGNNIYYQYFILESLLSRYKPELVIISTTVLEESEKSISNILPYMSDNILAKNIILEIAPIEYYKSLINVYRYNSLVVKIIQGNINQSNDSFNGYKPLYQRNNVNKNFNYSTKPYKIGLSQRTMDYYGRFLDLCNRKNVPVLVLNMPKFSLHSDLKEDFAIKRLIKNYKCKYLDYSKYTAIINRKEFFKDVSHLNNDGAIYFSKKLSHDIKSIYNVK